jgi:hypothetical protein
MNLALLLLWTFYDSHFQFQMSDHLHIKNVKKLSLFKSISLFKFLVSYLFSIYYINKTLKYQSVYKVFPWFLYYSCMLFYYSQFYVTILMQST